MLTRATDVLSYATRCLPKIHSPSHLVPYSCSFKSRFKPKKPVSRPGSWYRIRLRKRDCHKKAVLSQTFWQHQIHAHLLRMQAVEALCTNHPIHSRGLPRRWPRLEARSTKEENRTIKKPHFFMTRLDGILCYWWGWVCHNHVAYVCGGPTKKTAILSERLKGHKKQKGRGKEKGKREMKLLQKHISPTSQLEIEPCTLSKRGWCSNHWAIKRQAASPASLFWQCHAHALQFIRNCK